MNKLYMLIGVPGSGKSTWVKNQEWAKDCVYASTDSHIEEEAFRMGKTYNEVFDAFMPEAIDMMCNEIIKARNMGLDIIWDQTSCSIKGRKKKFNMLPDYYAIAVVFKTPEKAELDRRLASRPGKIIPAYVMKSMIESWQDPSEEEGFKEIWHAD